MSQISVRNQSFFLSTQLFDKTYNWGKLILSSKVYLNEYWSSIEFEIVIQNFEVTIKKRNPFSENTFFVFFLFHCLWLKKKLFLSCAPGFLSVKTGLWFWIYWGRTFFFWFLEKQAGKWLKKNIWNFVGDIFIFFSYKAL